MNPQSAIANPQSKEWLEADGHGGFASGTVSGIRTRRYHALLLTATTPPTGRMVLVNGFDAWIDTPAGRFALTSQCYAPDVIGGDGAQRIQEFTDDPWPTWIFQFEDGTRITQEIFVARGEGTTALTWKLLNKRNSVKLFLRPFLSGRDYHGLHKENGAFRFDPTPNGEKVLWRPYDGVPGIYAMYGSNGHYTHDPHWYRNFLYAEERARGLDATEDLASPGVFDWVLSASEAVWLLTTEGSPTLAHKGDLPVKKFLNSVRENERMRRAEFPSRLHRAADSYIVTGRHGKTIIAGYPWFADWGRDTFIAVRGLCLATGRLEDARDILLAWADSVSEGMLPNRFPDSGEQPEYNSVDASLWFVVAVHELLQAANGSGLVSAKEKRALQNAIEQIIAGYSRGTRFRIRADADGLLACGVPGVQLTWMDAKVGDWVVTPRIGKPVEIQTLWLNALKIAGQFSDQWEKDFQRGLKSFREKFWNEAGGFLFDVVDADDQAGKNDASFRPNQIFAVAGLPFQLVECQQAERIVAAVQEKLLTPLGLRSLAPGEPDYKPHYEGGVWQRDGAYHQGTVWPWLIGPFVEAWIRVHGATQKTRREAREQFLAPLLAHLDDAGLGHVSEIADAEPPHTPRGCPFQAWSVGELLRLDQLVLAEPMIKTKPTRKIVRETVPAWKNMNAEKLRLAEAHAGKAKWKHFGPYLSERQWGTVREDYSPGGTAWDYLPHDHARSRAYRWGEDGLAGISDELSRLCLSLALWNGKDPILKERIFGLTNSEGNHGEDAKELYYYLDATPTHSYLKMLYKYPQREFPYAQLVEENARRKGDSRLPEFELLDTGIFDDNRYFDVFVEYSKAGPEDILTRVTVHNRGPEPATIHLLPQLWFRNTWSWKPDAKKPQLSAGKGGAITAEHDELGGFNFYSDSKPENLFCDNETSARRLYGQTDAQGFFKDAFHEYVVNGNQSAVNPKRTGTKAGLLHNLTIPAGGTAVVRLRLSNSTVAKPFADFDSIFAQRITEADEFYAELQHGIKSPDERNVQRQAFAGMIWSKQFFYYDVPEWIKGDPSQPAPPAGRKHGRNSEWLHLNNADIISMPDKWEYPWYAAWDLAFHCIPLALVDAEFAKHQLVLLTREWYMHPNGQLPAYEWAFGDVNPPVHAWATWRVFQMDRKQRRTANPSDHGDLAFLERVFHKLMLNFTWWVNRKDTQGRNIFQGGFLGLDNIGVFDRSAPLPTGGFINQADGTSWMAMYSLNLMRIALELAKHNKVYEDIATKFFEHFLHIAEAMNNMGDEGIGLWCDKDEFYYDVLNLPSGQSLPIKIRSMVGLIPLFAVETLEPELLKQLPDFAGRLEWFLNYRPDLAKLVSRWKERGQGERQLLSLLRGHRMKCLLRRMLDETEFLSDHGVRALSKVHEREPYRFNTNGHTMEVGYWPAESMSGLFGGNSNWRGPVWMPVNFLLIESLQKFHHYYGDDFKIECPTGSGKFITINEVADELSRRLAKLFLKGDDGQRPALKYHPKLATDPHFKDYVLFHEYFHGDNGRGVGASHQTGWTGLIAKLLQPRERCH